MAHRSRPFSSAAFGDLLGLVAENTKARWPGMTPLMTGDVAWQLPGSAPKDNLRLWYDAKGLAGYAWLDPPATVKFDVRCGLSHDDGLADEMLDWAEARRLHFEPGMPFYIAVDSMEEWAQRLVDPAPAGDHDGHVLLASAFEADSASLDFLARRGFERTKHFEPFLARSLEELPDVEAPKGVTIRNVEAGEYEQRVDVHRASWWPASGFSLERYLEVRGISEVFDAELDIVAVAPDGSFAASCICWADPISGVGFYEPAGTRPEWRGSGVSRAVIRAGLHRLRAKGMAFARIYTAGFNHAAVRLYESCGFELVDRSRTHAKVLSAPAR
jgi:ribosomal protein S18 acetylase RimI-like enzyme